MQFTANNCELESKSYSKSHLKCIAIEFCAKHKRKFIFRPFIHFFVGFFSIAFSRKLLNVNINSQGCLKEDWAQFLLVKVEILDIPIRFKCKLLIIELNFIALILILRINCHCYNAFHSKYNWNFIYIKLACSICTLIKIWLCRQFKRLQFILVLINSFFSCIL